MPSILGMRRISPSLRVLAFVIPLEAIMASMETEKSAAIPETVSPLLTL
jgi:hypothetical protein